MHPTARRAAARCGGAIPSTALPQTSTVDGQAYVVYAPSDAVVHRRFSSDSRCSTPPGFCAARPAAARPGRMRSHWQSPTAHRSPVFASAGQLEAARALLECGASSSVPCEGSPPLHVAVCVSAHPDKRAFAEAAVALLLQHGADPYERWVREHTLGVIGAAAQLARVKYVGVGVQSVLGRC